MGTQLPSPKRGTAPPILAHVYCDQMARWIKMPLGTEVTLDPGHIVLDGDATPPPKGTIFGSCLLWPNGWMDQDATWYGRRPRPRWHCVRWGPSSPKTPRKGEQHPPFQPMSIVVKWSPISTTADYLLFLVHFSLFFLFTVQCSNNMSALFRIIS